MATQKFPRGRKKSATARKKQRSLQLRIQSTIAVLALVVLVGLRYVDTITFATLKGTAAPSVVYHDVALEYQAKASAVFTLARKGENALLMVKNDSALPLKVSLPKVWQLTEVSGADIQILKETSDIPSASFIRWILPAGSRLTFLGRSVPTSLTFMSPSSQPAAITLHTLDLIDGFQYSQVLLLQGSVKAQNLWEE